MPVVTIVKYRDEQKNKWKSTKAKRIAQVSFQAKIDASHGSTRARSEAREIQNTTIDASRNNRKIPQRTKKQVEINKS